MEDNITAVEFAYNLVKEPLALISFLVSVFMLILLAKYTGLKKISSKGFEFNVKRRVGEVTPGHIHQGHQEHQDNSPLVTIEYCNSRQALIDGKIIDIYDELEKLVFYSNASPVVRLQAGLRHIHSNRNDQHGFMKKDVQELSEEFPYEYHLVGRLHPELHIFPHIENTIEILEDEG